LQKTPEPVKPVAVMVFANKPDLEKLSIFQKCMGGKVKAPRQETSGTGKQLHCGQLGCRRSSASKGCSGSPDEIL
jgi:hypothetical protein